MKTLGLAAVIVTLLALSVSGSSDDQFYAAHADTFLNLPVFYGGWDSEDSCRCLDSSHALHPSVQYVENGFAGFRYWMAYSPVCISESDENPHIAVSNDGETWQLLILESDTLKNPLFEFSRFNATHLSDPDLTFDQSNQRLLLVFRVTWEIAGKDSHAVFISASYNGHEWSEPSRVLSDGLLGQGNISAFVSPSMVANADSTYTIYVVEPYALGITFADSTRLVRYATDNIQNCWAFADTCLLLPPPGKKLWHLSLMPPHEDTLLALGTFSPDGWSNYGDSAELYQMISCDNGLTWTCAPEPFLSWSTDPTAWYGQTLYRASACPAEFGDGELYRLYYSAKAKPISAGGSGTGWNTGTTFLSSDITRAPVVRSLKIDGQVAPPLVYDLNPRCEWSYLDPGGNCQQAFEIEIGTDLNWSTADVWQSGTVLGPATSISIPHNVLQPDNDYSVRIRLSNDISWSSWYETSFHTATLEPPILLRPVNDTLLTTTHPDFWILNTQPENPSVTYDLLVMEHPGSDIVWVSQQDIPQTSDSTVWHCEMDLPDNLNLWWAAQARSGDSHSDWTPFQPFWIDETPQAPFATWIYSPNDSTGSPVYTLTPEFSWSWVSDYDPFDTVRYILQVSPRSAFNVFVICDTVSSNERPYIYYTPADSLVCSSHYWWRVVTVDKYGLTTTSLNTRQFDTWISGDCDGNNSLDIADMVLLVELMYGNGPAPDPPLLSDLNADCITDISDLVYLIAYMFADGEHPRPGCQ